MVKAQQEKEFSQQRREEFLAFEQKKNLKNKEEKNQEGKKKEMEKLNEGYKNKELLIEKARKEIRENYEQKSSLLGLKISLRKKDQEENLKRIQLQKAKEKSKLLEKLIESEPPSKTKFELNLSKIYAEAEKEFRNLKPSK